MTYATLPDNDGATARLLPPHTLLVGNNTGELGAQLFIERAALSRR